MEVKYQDELQRLVALNSLELDYSEIEPYLKDLTQLASRVANKGISLINLLDNHTSWTVSSEGIDLTQLPKEDAVCKITIQDEEGFEVEDLSADSRFSDKHYVKEGPKLKYYYGVPLKSREGHNIGTLCVFDEKAQKLEPEKKELLNFIGKEVENRLYLLAENNAIRKAFEEAQDDQKKISHDLRSPLTGIIGLAKIIEKEIENIETEDLLEFIKLIRESSQSLLELVDSIMDKIEEKKNTTQKIGEKLSEKLRSMYRPQAVQKGINFTIQCDEKVNELDFKVIKVVQIAGNLLSNAIKFTEEGGSVSATISSNKTGDLEIIVRDSGRGMNQEQMRDIVEQKPHSMQGTKGEKGYGFGLQLVNHLVKKSGGTMQIESEAGDGTSFTIHYPCD